MQGWNKLTVISAGGKRRAATDLGLILATELFETRDLGT